MVAQEGVVERSTPMKGSEIQLGARIRAVVQEIAGTPGQTIGAVRTAY